MKRIVIVLATLASLSAPALAQTFHYGYAQQQSSAPSDVNANGGDRAPITGGGY